MVSPWHFVTAAHCLTENFEEFNIVLRGQTYKVVEERPSNCYDVKTGLPNPADVAIMVLESPIPDAVEGEDFLKIWDGSTNTMKDQVFTLVGWGNSGGVGTSGDQDYDVFHVAKNKVNTIHDNMLVYTMDTEADGGEYLEGIGNSGDSGGPALLRNPETGDWNIGGVKSNGQCCGWGSEAEYTRLGGLAYDWLIANIQYDENGPAAAVPIEEGRCAAVWNDPSNDGEDWEEMFIEWDQSPRDERVDFTEFREYYDWYACSAEGARPMFDRLDKNGDN